MKDMQDTSTNLNSQLVIRRNATYLGKTINTLYERFHGTNGHLHPSTKLSRLQEHLAANISPNCKFKFNKIKILDACTDLKL